METKYSIYATMRASLALVMIISIMLILMTMIMIMMMMRWRSKRMMKMVMMMRSAEQCVKACWLHGQGAARTGTMDSNGTLA